MEESKGRCVPTDQDEPFEEQAVTGRRKQNLPFFRNLSGGQNAGVDTCDQEGVRSPPPKSTAAGGEGLRREAPLRGTGPPRKLPQ